MRILNKNNFIRTHQGLGKTPAEEAELCIPPGRNRLLDLIFFDFSDYWDCAA